MCCMHFTISGVGSILPSLKYPQGESVLSACSSPPAELTFDDFILFVVHSHLNPGHDHRFSRFLCELHVEKLLFQTIFEQVTGALERQEGLMAQVRQMSEQAAVFSFL